MLRWVFSRSNRSPSPGLCRCDGVEGAEGEEVLGMVGRGGVGEGGAGGAGEEDVGEEGKRWEVPAAAEDLL